MLGINPFLTAWTPENQESKTSKGGVSFILLLMCKKVGDGASSVCGEGLCVFACNMGY